MGTATAAGRLRARRAVRVVVPACVAASALLQAAAQDARRLCGGGGGGCRSSTRGVTPPLRRRGCKRPARQLQKKQRRRRLAGSCARQTSRLRTRGHAHAAGAATLQRGGQAAACAAATRARLRAARRQAHARSADSPATRHVCSGASCCTAGAVAAHLACPLRVQCACCACSRQEARGSARRWGGRHMSSIKPVQRHSRVPFLPASSPSRG